MVESLNMAVLESVGVDFTAVSAGAVAVSVGATVSTGSVRELTTLLLLCANELLTVIITIIAITVNANFFIIFCFLKGE